MAAMTALAAGIRAPEFSLKGIDGATFSLDPSTEETTLLVFFKNSCPTCLLALPFLQRLYRRVEGTALRFWGISQDSPDETRAFALRCGLTFPLLPDPPGYPVSDAYGLTNVPTLFLVEARGILSRRSMGFSRADLESLASELQRRFRSGGAGPLFAPSEDVPALRPG